MPSPGFSDFVLPALALTLPVSCTVETRRNILSIEGTKKDMTDSEGRRLYGYVQRDVSC